MLLQDTFEELQKDYYQTPYLSVRERRDVLKALKKRIREKAVALADAMNSDFSHRAQIESLFLEIYPTLKSIDYCLAHLNQWTRKRKRKLSWHFLPGKAYLIPQPLGVVGIMVPWNYPVFLSIIPAIYALAAGNRVMIKMSELTPKTTEALQSLFDDHRMIRVTGGDVSVSREFARLPFGHLLFTGSTAVGKSVMAAASEHLTPVTLELGGKSPAIVSKTMDKQYYNRLFMGKLFNAGQTCIAPDYLYIPAGQESQLERELHDFINRHYPNLPSNQDYSSIINEQHKERLLQLVEDARQKGARVVTIGEPNDNAQKIPFYLLFDVNESMKVMQEEIFGPILPVLSYQSINEAVKYINDHPNPLAVYYFGNDREELQTLQYQVLSGALTVNDSLIHVAVDDLPFGGVGHSGMGQYHGREGFDTFSKLKPVLIKRKLALITFLYPPYGKLMRSFLHFFAGIKLREK
ncbi:coniferyl aldehyde dehydrogenase [Legionella spiritensis]|uniref:Aldehyde dehydrogenase n=1 Tax=Legionella spiritensis TaxID=452 RepID=A0A0W0Z4K2_LEGSP|nr:coniferyl aldehyde dehydrogenase [Legionella spiritensis]KTD64059.1 alcohol dehydrogenase [Legionella spiritensis]SNV37485.1 alcohol dehydrogenase [Legionella spiritensis]